MTTEEAKAKEEHKLHVATEMPPELAESPQEGAGYDIPTPPSPEEAERMKNARKVRTAFLVVIEHDGASWATNDINMDIYLDRPPSAGDIYKACAEVMMDIETSTSAQKTVAMMMQATAQVAEHQRQQKIAAKLAEKGIRVPGR